MTWQLNSHCTHTYHVLPPPSLHFLHLLLCTLNNEAIFALNSHMQAITSVFRLEWASIKLANNAKTLQQPRWLASPSLPAAPLGSWHAHEVQWKSIEILLRGRFICILSQVALAISRCHLHNRHHHPFGMTITCPEHVASIKKGKGVSRGNVKGEVTLVRYQHAWHS